MERKNWEIYLHYSRGENEECCALIEEVLHETKGQSGYAVYVKGLLYRHEGKIQESLVLFQAASCMNPNSIRNLKEVARSLFLLGRHSQAIHIYNKAQENSADDWEIWHAKGVSYMYLKQYNEACECFRAAMNINKHDETFIQLGRVQTQMRDYNGAIQTYLEAVDYSPENTEILTTLGLLHLNMGQMYKAFDYLGNSLTRDNMDPKTILAAGSVIQDHGDMDVALSKYRAMAQKAPNSPQMWNNVGMCFFGKCQYVSAIICLKRALSLSPFEWIINYNIGTVHLSTQQYASSFHYLSASIHLKPNYAQAYMYLGVVLARLGDRQNSISAYQKALKLKDSHLIRLNFAVTLLRIGHAKAAMEQFTAFEKHWGELPAEKKNGLMHVEMLASSFEKEVLKNRG